MPILAARKRGAEFASTRGVLRVILVTAVLTSTSFQFVVAQDDEISSGSGILVGAHGEILTNSHVVEDCKTITVKMPAQDSETAALFARDRKNDLAVIRAKTPSSVPAAFREGTPIRAGDTVIALGYPLSGLLASTANLSVGTVSALAGIGDDTRYLQISAPVQAGNSGGPLLDGSGHIVGIVTAKLDAARVARATGDIPQNVNFALKAQVARTFLDSNSIAYQTAPSNRQLSPADVGDVARPFTVHIRCSKDSPRSVAKPKGSGSPAPAVVAANAKHVPLAYSPWTKVCGEGGAAGIRCRTVRIGRLETGQFIGEAAILEPLSGEQNTLRITVFKSNDVLIPPGTRLSVDGGKWLNAPWLACPSKGCIVDYPISDDLMMKLRGGDKLDLQLINQNKQTESYIFPLSDFAKAYDGPGISAVAFDKQQKDWHEQLQRR